MIRFDQRIETLLLALNKLHSKADKQDSAHHITQEIYNFYVKNKYLLHIEEDPKNKLTASAIIYSKHHSQILQFGDCHCLVDNQYFESNKHIHYITSSARSLIIGSLLLKGHSIDELLEKDLSREFIQPFLIINKVIKT